MDDKQIRDKMFAYFKSIDLDMRLFQEKSLGSSRCDIMAVTDTVTGYEIKSDSDSYARLKRQIRDYDLYLTYNYLVVGESHLRSAEGHIPGYWGIYCCNEHGIRLIRKAEKNPNTDDMVRLTGLLWKRELKDLADRHNISCRAKDKYSLASSLIRNLGNDVLDREIAFELDKRDYSDYNAKDYTMRIESNAQKEAKKRGLESLLKHGGYSGIDKIDNEELDLLIRELIDIKKRRTSKKNRKKTKVSAELSKDYKNPYTGCEMSGSSKRFSIPDAFTHCLSTLGKVDLEYISAISGSGIKECISVLKGSILQNPMKWDKCFYKGWETKDEYLSGNMLSKYNIAKRANEKYRGYFQRNMKEIRKVIPNKVYYENIYFTLGSPFVPEIIVESFLVHIMNGYYLLDSNNVSYDEETGRWKIRNKSFLAGSYQANKKYGTPVLSAIELFDKTLNMRPIELFRTAGGKKELDEEETAFAVERQKKLIEDFREYVNASREFRKIITDRYNNHYGYIHRRIFDGSFLELPGLNPEISLYKYQKDAVARILFTRNTLLCHEVGSGKTYIMIAAGHEMKRMGISLRNMYVVPNNIVGQWRKMYSELYSDASVLVVDHKNFSRETLKIISESGFDAIIISGNCFDKIPFDKDQPDDICFKDLGITRLFVDESHYYKNLGIGRQTTRVLGINVKGSKRAKHMLQITDYLNSLDGRGIIFATATPITNTIVEAFALQKYLQADDLKRRKINNFPAWIRTFAEVQTDIEVDVDTSRYRNAMRFSKFHNMREFTNLLSLIADFHEVDISNNIPDYKGPEEIYLDCSGELKKYLNEISERVDAIRAGVIDKKADNMLKVTIDGRKAALDLRLVSEDVSEENNKVSCCAEKVREIYDMTAKEKSTQVVFCDQSVPKASFNIYNDMKTKLVASGIPLNEIAFIHDAADDRERLGLFRKVNEGQIRILIGSSIKLGTGVNIQKKLIAAHHLDVPWRPADMTQREGRIIRQGNENKEVFIFRYITKESFDAYSWQLLEKKQHFIKELLKGSWSGRDAEDIENTVLTYAEVKALAVGSRLLKKRYELENELKKYKVLQKKTAEERIELSKELEEIPLTLKKAVDKLERTLSDINEYKAYRKDHDADAAKDKREKYRRLLSDGIKNHGFEVSERELFRYKGFSLVLPANTDPEEPVVVMRGKNRYEIRLGKSKTGNLTRIDNFINNLYRVAERTEKEINETKGRRLVIEEKLSGDENYEEVIDNLKLEIDNIDKRLKAMI